MARLRYYEGIAGTGRPREDWETTQLSQFLDYVWSRQHVEGYKSVVEAVRSYSNANLDLGSTVKSILIITGGDAHIIDAFRRCLPGGYDVQVSMTGTNLHYIRATQPPNPSTVHVALIPFVSEANPRWADARVKELLYATLHQTDLETAFLSLEGDDVQRALDCIQKELDESRSLKLETGRNKSNRQRMAHLMDNLSRAHDMFPQAFFISGLYGRLQAIQSPGTHSILFSVTHHGAKFAVKHMRITSDHSEEMAEYRMAFWHDALVWRQLWHPNIVPVLGIDKENFEGRINLVLPWFPHGHILDHIKYMRPIPEIAQLNQWIKEIAGGLDYLHSELVIHGGVRAHNVLIDSEGHARLTDYGVETNLKFGDICSIDAGYAWWTAPELINPDLFGASGHPTYASDIFAFSLCCVEIFSGKHPFAAMLPSRRRNFVLSGARPERPSPPTGFHMDDDMWSLVQKCWAQEPNNRPDSAAVFRLVP